MGRLLSLLGGHNLGSLHGLGGAVTNLAGSVLIEALLLVSATHCLVAIMAAGHQIFKILHILLGAKYSLDFLQISLAAFPAGILFFSLLSLGGFLLGLSGSALLFLDGLDLLLLSVGQVQAFKLAGLLGATLLAAGGLIAVLLLALLGLGAIIGAGLIVIFILGHCGSGGHGHYGQGHQKFLHFHFLVLEVFHSVYDSKTQRHSEGLFR